MGAYLIFIMETEYIDGVISIFTLGGLKLTFVALKSQHI